MQPSRLILLWAVCVLVLFACGRARAPIDAVILADTPAKSLADYGLFTDAAARKPASGVVKYDLINPLFSDHADKHRLVYMPIGTQAQVDTDGAVRFPIGTVLVKSFAYGERYLETRLLIHKASGWQALPYVWNSDQTEAVYAPVGKRIPIAVGEAAPDAPAFTYAVPNKNQCKTCHQTGDAVVPIGPKLRNLDHLGPNGVNQIQDWQARGWLASAPDVVKVMPDALDSSAPLNERARAYLDINCGHCHKATGSASNSGLWLSWTETDAIKLGFGKHPTAAGRGSGRALYVITPGDPDASILAHRMASNEPGVAMPELGRALVDAYGVALIREWIANTGEAEES